MEWDTIFTILCYFGFVLQASLLPAYTTALSGQGEFTGIGYLFQACAAAAMWPFFFLQ